MVSRIIGLPLHYVLGLAIVVGMMCAEPAGLGVLQAETVAVVLAEDWCDEICDASAECDEPCWNDLLLTTCGEYENGSAGGWCDGDTCEDLCGPGAAPSQVCWSEGESTDCSVYGDYAQCDDGYCATFAGESCSTCEEDCGCPPEPTCGANGCELGETFRTCSQDCSEPTGGSCDDGTCDAGEDGDNCPEDCTFSGDLGQPPSSCPQGWEPLGDTCVWNDPILVCCDEDSCGGEAMCTASEICAPFGSTFVCRPRWPS